MANPFTPLQNALRVLGTEAQVPPATGQAQVDQAAAQLWGLTDEELADIQASSKELKG